MEVFLWRGGPVFLPLFLFGVVEMWLDGGWMVGGVVEGGFDRGCARLDGIQMIACTPEVNLIDKV